MFQILSLFWLPIKITVVFCVTLYTSSYISFLNILVHNSIHLNQIHALHYLIDSMPWKRTLNHHDLAVSTLWNHCFVSYDEPFFAMFVQFQWLCWSYLNLEILSVSTCIYIIETSGFSNSLWTKININLPWYENFCVWAL